MLTLQKNEATTRQRMMKAIRQDAALHIMLLLPLTILFIYHYVPMGGLIIAFEKYKPAKGILGSSWVGLDNFRKLFATSGFSSALINTITISVGKLTLNIIIPVSFSLLLNEMASIKTKRILQSIIYLPHFISWVIMASIIGQILSPSTGIVNRLLLKTTGKTIFFLGDNNWFQPVLIGTSIWKNFGYSTVVYLAALSAVDPTLLEVAEIDGAGHWKRMVHITIPCITPTILLMATLSIGNILNAGFDQVYNLLNSSVMKSGDILDTLVYRYGIQQANYSMSTAAGLFKSSISAVLMIVSYRLAYNLSGYRLF
ncbi:MAG: ABC transporter permease [Christensenellales bacterium]